MQCKKHHDVFKYGKRVDMSDLVSDPLLRFQHKFYPIIVPFVCFLLPIMLSVNFFGENFSTALYVNMARYMFTLHITWSINSVSHIYGDKPFEKYEILMIYKFKHNLFLGTSHRLTRILSELWLSVKVGTTFTMFIHTTIKCQSFHAIGAILQSHSLTFLHGLAGLMI